MIKTGNALRFDKVAVYFKTPSVQKACEKVKLSNLTIKGIPPTVKYSGLKTFVDKIKVGNYVGHHAVLDT